MRRRGGPSGGWSAPTPTTAAAAALAAAGWLVLLWAIVTYTTFFGGAADAAPAAAAPAAAEHGDGPGGPRLPPYAVVIDAGSSGSRVSVFAVHVADAASLPQFEVVDAASAPKIEPGLSTYANRLEEIAGYLQPLLEFAAAAVPVHAQRATPLYLLATAGLRLLPASRQQSILHAVCATVQAQTSFLFTCEQARVISGEAEGVFGWVAANYLRGHLGHAGASDANRPVGFLDMGGGSAQVVFEVDDPIYVERAQPLPLFSDPDDGDDREASGSAPADAAPERWNVFEVDLSFDPRVPRKYTVYGVSHLEFGANSARDRYDQALESARRTEDPCRHDGALGPGMERRIDNGDGVDDDQDLRIGGTSDFDGCLNALADMDVLRAKSTVCVPTPPCPFNGVNLPPLRGDFVAISEFWYTNADVFGFHQYNPEQFAAAARQYCARSHADIMDALARGEYVANQRRLETQCFKAAWVFHVLHDGLGFPRDVDDDSETPQVLLADSINGAPISWTLGALLVLLAQLHRSSWAAAGGADGRGFVTLGDDRAAGGAVPPAGPLLWAVVVAVTLLAAAVAVRRRARAPYLRGSPAPGMPRNSSSSRLSDLRLLEAGGVEYSKYY